MGSAVTIHNWHLLCYLSSLCQQQQDRQFAYKRDIEAISRKYFCSGKAISVKYFESVCNHIRHARRFRHIILSSVPSLSPPFCQHYLINGAFFWKTHTHTHTHTYIYIYTKTCLKRNAIVPVFFSVFTGFRFTKGCVLIKQSTKNMIA